MIGTEFIIDWLIFVFVAYMGYLLGTLIGYGRGYRVAESRMRALKMKHNLASNTRYGHLYRMDERSEYPTELLNVILPTDVTQEITVFDRLVRGEDDA